MKECEKVTAIMVTGKDRYHESLARLGVKNFIEQTYKNKFLVIVNDGEYSLKDIECDNVKEIRPSKSSLGALRNVGLNEVKNGIVLQWDDDDWRVGNLIELQTRLLRESKADICLLKRQLRYSFVHDSAYVFKYERGIWGTILHRANDVRYPEIEKGEDTQYLSKLSMNMSVYVMDNPSWYYCRFFHGHNVWDAEHFGFRDGEKRIDVSEKGYLAKVIKMYKEVGI